MNAKPAILILALVAGVLFAASPAHAVRCGEPDPAAKPPSTQPVRATIALDEKSSRTILAFKRDKGHQAISLVFNVTGCEMPPGEPPKPRLLVLTKGGSKDFDDDVLSVKSVDAEAFGVRGEGGCGRGQV
jgi:hypothetical protein